MQSIASLGKSLPGLPCSDLAETSEDINWLSKSVKKVSDGLFTYMKAPEHYYVMERIGHDNKSHWQRYCDQQHQAYNKVAISHALACSKAVWFATF